MSDEKQGSRDRAEQAFLESYDPTEFEHPSLAVDLVILTVRDGELLVALVRRDDHPDKGTWALPGGFVAMHEGLDAAAARVLETKAGQRTVFLEQLYTFGEPGRDPRTRVVSVSYYALVNTARLEGLAARGVLLGRLRVPWKGESGGRVDVLDDSGRKLPTAFDHADIIAMSVKRIRGKLDYAPIGFQLLPATFTLRALQDIHEAILGTV
ncbi:MAG: NUDIX hydrolase, partial [Gammaproteobacteria bacterium]|nr:NUDIX hydrolase [Gammaproteobacteria bacterium]